MGTFDNLEPEISGSFAEQTEEVKEQLIQQWSQQCYAWINRARIFINQSNSIAKQLTNTSVETIADFQKQMKGIRAAQELLSQKSLLSDGYILLNKIGERIRGETILYNITISKTGAALSSGDTGGVITIKVPLEEFLNITQISSGNIKMKKTSTIYNMIEKQRKDSEAKKSYIQYEKWDDQKIKSFEIFASQVRSLKNYEKINEGNILEAFARHVQDGGLIISNADYSDKRYWSQIYSSVLNTLKSPDPFWKGGDIGAEQLKGLNASVTNINTLIRNINEVLKGLRQTKIGAQQLQPYVKKNFMNKIEEEGNQSIEQGEQFLIKFFTSNIDRTNNFNDYFSFIHNLSI